jgi:hypothetical protein
MSTRLGLAGEGSTYIACPLKEARTEMVSPLSEGWWQTPQVFELKRVKTEVIAGKPTLVCLYGAYGGEVGVMHLYPKGMSNCRPEKSGFRCTASSKMQ